jgi:hypothetical protein
VTAPPRLQPEPPKGSGLQPTAPGQPTAEQQKVPPPPISSLQAAPPKGYGLQSGAPAKVTLEQHLANLAPERRAAFEKHVRALGLDPVQLAKKEPAAAQQEIETARKRQQTGSAATQEAHNAMTAMMAEFARLSAQMGFRKY